MSTPRRRLESVPLDHELSPRLQHWVGQLERSRWPGWLVDEDFALRYVSTELRSFMEQSLGHPVDDEAMGIGHSMMHALFHDAWRSCISADSLLELMPRAMSYLKGEFSLSDEEARAFIPEALWPFYEAADTKVGFGILSERFMYTLPRAPLAGGRHRCRLRSREGSLHTCRRG